jgi:hypothetical protein
MTPDNQQSEVTSNNTLKLSYKDVLQAKNRVGCQQDLNIYALNLGYIYYAWNGRIYKSNLSRPEDTGILESELLN